MTDVLTLLRAQLLIDENLRLRPYPDTTGHLTIGVGRNLDTIGVTRDEALYLLDNDIARVHVEARQAWPWVAALDPVRQAVLLNMLFNLGLPRLKTFRRFLAALEAGEYQRAADEMLASRWAKQVGDRAQRLAQQMHTGEI